MYGTQSSVPQCKNQVEALHTNNKCQRDVRSQEPEVNKCQCVKQVWLIHHCATISSSFLMDLKEETLAETILHLTNLLPW